MSDTHAQLKVEPDKQEKPPEKSVRFSWTIINFWLDTAILVNFVVVLWISALLQFVFPASLDAAGWELWGSNIVDWQNYQFIALSIFSIGILIHVCLHWSWICGVINKRIFQRTLIKSNGTDTLIGVGIIAAILHFIGISILIAMWMVSKPSP